MLLYAGGPDNLSYTYLELVCLYTYFELVCIISILIWMNGVSKDKTNDLSNIWENTICPKPWERQGQKDHHLWGKQTHTDHDNGIRARAMQQHVV